MPARIHGLSYSFLTFFSFFFFFFFFFFTPFFLLVVFARGQFAHPMFFSVFWSVGTIWKCGRRHDSGNDKREKIFRERGEKKGCRRR